MRLHPPDFTSGRWEADLREALGQLIAVSPGGLPREKDARICLLSTIGKYRDRLEYVVVLRCVHKFLHHVFLTVSDVASGTGVIGRLGTGLTKTGLGLLYSAYAP